MVFLIGQVRPWSSPALGQPGESYHDNYDEAPVFIHRYSVEDDKWGIDMHSEPGIERDLVHGSCWLGDCFYVSGRSKNGQKPCKIYYLDVKNRCYGKETGPSGWQ